MNKTLLVAMLASTTMMPSAKAEETTTLPAPGIAIVEQATLDKSAALKSIVQQVDKKRAEIQKEMSAYETDLKAQDKKLAEEQKKLSKEEFAKKRQDCEKKVQGAQAKLEIRRAQMELAIDEAKKKVYDAFLKVSEELRKKSGAPILIYKETVVTADPKLDLSKEALEKLDKALPTVTVTFKSEDEVKKQLQALQPQVQPKAK